METPRQRYPISSQPFPEIREKGLTCIDKADVIYEMVSDINFDPASRTINDWAIERS